MLDKTKTAQGAAYQLCPACHQWPNEEPPLVQVWAVDIILE